MLDFQVAFDKLAQFETADEIAEFLGGQNIKAVPQSGDRCAISAFMTGSTGMRVFTGGRSIFIDPPRNFDGGVRLTDADDYRDLTIAMQDFVHKYDDNQYPELVLSWEEENAGTY